MATNSTTSSGKTFLLMAAYVLIGVPLVAVLWELLNDVLALKIELNDLLIGVPVLLLFIGYLKVLSRRLQQWGARDSADGST